MIFTNTRSRIKAATIKNFQFPSQKWYRKPLFWIFSCRFVLITIYKHCDTEFESCNWSQEGRIDPLRNESFAERIGQCDNLQIYALRKKYKTHSAIPNYTGSQPIIAFLLAYRARNFSHFPYILFPFNTISIFHIHNLTPTARLWFRLIYSSSII